MIVYACLALDFAAVVHVFMSCVPVPQQHCSVNSTTPQQEHSSVLTDAHYTRSCFHLGV